MTDREMVIKALECISNSTKQPCRDCEYSEREEWCVEECAKDALALLKAQEPRVFNVGDFYGEEFGYLEYRPKIPGFSNFEPSPILISDIDEENVTVIFRSASVLKLPLDKMEKSWRIWSDYPTHELLKAVKWDA